MLWAFGLGERELAFEIRINIAHSEASPDCNMALNFSKECGLNAT